MNTLLQPRRDTRNRYKPSEEIVVERSEEQCIGRTMDLNLHSWVDDSRAKSKVKKENWDGNLDQQRMQALKKIKQERLERIKQLEEKECSQDSFELNNDQRGKSLTENADEDLGEPTATENIPVSESKCPNGASKSSKYDLLEKDERKNINTHTEEDMNHMSSDESISPANNKRKLFLNNGGFTEKKTLFTSARVFLKKV